MYICAVCSNLRPSGGTLYKEADHFTLEVAMHECMREGVRFSFSRSPLFRAKKSLLRQQTCTFAARGMRCMVGGRYRLAACCTAGWD